MAKKKFYDGKQLFEFYHGLGAAATLEKTAEWAGENGMGSPENGRASKMGVRSAMWRWACDNPEESYEIWKRYHFERYPYADIPTIKEYVEKTLIPMARNNPSVASNKDIEILRARFDVSYAGVSKVKKNDVIQIVDPDLSYTHPVSGMRQGMYGKLLIVDNVLPEEGFAIARMINGDDTYSNHQLKYGQFGVIGRSIVV